MKLVINKDFTKEYKNDAWRGFTITELLSILCGLAIMVISMYGLNQWTGIPLATCVYASVPVAAPVVAVGFFKYQEMNGLRALMEIWYSKKTARLTCEIGEYPGGKVFRMQSSLKSGISEKEWKKRKKLYKKRRRNHKTWDY